MANAQFEAEISNSLQKLQATVARLEQSTAKAQASMRGLGTATAQASTQTSSLASNMAKVQASASRAGGAMGGAVAQVASLAALNPAMLAVGAAIGAIVASVSALSDKIQEINGFLPGIAAQAEKIRTGRAAAGGKALMDADLGSLRERVMRPTKATGGSASADAASYEFGISNEVAQARVSALQKSAPRLKLTADQLIQEAAGYGDMDPAEYNYKSRLLGEDPVFTKARDKQFGAAASAAEAQRDLQITAAGGQTETDRKLAKLNETIEKLSKVFEDQKTGMITREAVIAPASWIYSAQGGEAYRDPGRETMRQIESLQSQARILSGQAAESGR